MAKMAQAAGATKAFGASVLTSAEKNRAAFSTLGLAATALGGLMAFGLKKSTEAAIQFESSIMKLTTQVGIARNEADAMGESLLKMGDTGRGPLELADALFFVTSAGLRGADALSVVEASAKGAAIGLGETKVIADLVTSAMNAYGPSVLSAAEATDVLVGTVRAGKAEAPALAGAMGKVLPIASQMKVSFDEVGAAVAAMTRTGTEASTATVQLRAILISLLKPTKQSAGQLSELGLSAQGLRDTIATDGLWAALQQLKGALGDNDEAIAKVFPNVRALAGFLDLMGANAKDNAQVFAGLANSTSLLADGFEEWSKTTEAAGARFSASMESAKIAAGQVLLPALKAFLDVATGFVNFFNSLPGPARTAAVAFAALSSGMLLLAGATLLLLPRIAATKAALATMGIQAGVMRGSLIAAGRFMLGPWGLALTAGALLLNNFVSNQRQAADEVSNFTSALQASGGAINDYVREAAAMNLEGRGALEAAERLGIGLDVVTEAVLGGADAMEELRGQLRALKFTDADDVQLADDLRLLEEAANDVGGSFENAKAEAERLASAAGESSGPLGEMGGALGDLQGELGETISLSEQLRDEFDLLSGAALGLDKAAVGFRNALSGMKDTIEDNDKTLNLFTQSGRDNRDAIRGSLEAALDHAVAMAENGASIDQVEGKVRSHIRAVMEQATAAGIAKGDVKDYIRQLNLTPKDIKTLIQLMNLETSLGGIDRLKAALDRIPRRITTEIAVSQTKIPQTQLTGKHSGGLAGTTGFNRMTGPPRGDEFTTVLQKGEMVLPRGASFGRTITNIYIDARGAAPGVASDLEAVMDRHLDKHAVKEARHFRTRR